MDRHGDHSHSCQTDLRVHVVVEHEPEAFPQRPASNFFALGAGTNMIWVDPEHDLVVVVRWIDRREIDGFIQRLLAAVKSPVTNRSNMRRPSG